jgi:hypothetical protein
VLLRVNTCICGCSMGCSVVNGDEAVGRVRGALLAVNDKATIYRCASMFVGW